MGAYCIDASIPRHEARSGEIMEVRWIENHGPVLFGDNREIACIPHKGCRLEIVGTAATTDRKIDLLLPGQVLRYKRSFFLGDRLKLPSGANVGFDRLVGFRFQLVEHLPASLPDETIATGKVTESERGGSPATKHSWRMAAKI